MKKTNKLWLALLLTVLVAALIAVGFTAAAEEPTITHSGTHDTNITWTFDSEGTLTVSGEGSLNSSFWASLSQGGVSLFRVRTVVIEDGITSLLNGVFRGFSYIEQLTLPNTLTHLGQGVFSGCVKLKSVVIPDSVVATWGQTFENCRALESVTISSGLKAIESGMFQGCVSLTSVTIPDGVKTIKGAAFNGCTALANVVIPDSVETVGEKAFHNTSWLASQPDGVVYAGKVAYLYKGEMPENTTIDLMEGCKEISKNAFYQCTGLKSITMPDSLKAIGESAFRGCTSLDQVVIPPYVTSISTSAFADCSALETIVLPEDLTGISGYMFHNCAALTGLDVPARVTRIDNTAFLGCDALRSIRVDAENTNYSSDENGLLYNKDQTTLLRFPAGCPLLDFSVSETVRRIESYACYGCKVLKNLTIPDNTVICSYAFNACTALENLVISKEFYEHSPGRLGQVFNGCTALSSITVSPENTMYYSVDNCVIDRDRQTLVLACKTSAIPRDGSVIHADDYAFVSTPENFVVPSFLTYGEYVFVGCTTLRKVVLEPGFTETPGSFLPNSVTAVVIPDSVTKISEYFCASYFSGYNSQPNENFVIYYTGSEEQWNQIEIRNWAESFPNQNIVVANKQFNYQFQSVAATPSTCTAPGYTEGLFCDVADIWVSGHEVLPLADHIPAAAVHENEVAATCTEAGGYDEVIYCTKCPAEISRTHIDVPAPGHAWGEWVVVKQATTDEEGLMRRTCQNDPSHVEEQVIPKLQPQTNAFQQFIEMIKSFFENLTEWIRRLFRW